ncbi:hypothetical protein FQN51_005655 [Onygenales sp. PD_10]|nr:hypothetical protein FQN51_005655 [Onygenales sp. PD_10]
MCYYQLHHYTLCPHTALAELQHCRRLYAQLLRINEPVERERDRNRNQNRDRDRDRNAGSGAEYTLPFHIPRSCEPYPENNNIVSHVRVWGVCDGCVAEREGRRDRDRDRDRGGRGRRGWGRGDWEFWVRGGR